MSLTQKQLKNLLCYDPDTGVFIRRKNNKVAGHPLASRPYLRTMLRGREYYMHRLAFLYMTGSFPEKEVDHVNGVKDDNRWANLRTATPFENSVNVHTHRSHNKLGVLGVSPSGSKFIAKLTTKGRQQHLGTFDTAEEAHNAYLEEKRKQHKTCTL